MEWGCYLAKPTITRRPVRGRSAARKVGAALRRTARYYVRFRRPAGGAQRLIGLGFVPLRYLQRCVEQFQTAAQPTV